jgi:membrane protease YdiL (CAAX protease family)
MIPPELPLEPAVAVTEAPREEAFWDYADLGLFIFLSIVSLLAALLLVRFIPALHALQDAYKLLAGQAIWYVFVLGSLAAILRVRYDRGFWQSLGWRAPQMGSAVGSLALGPVLAIGLGLIGAAMRTPQIPLPFETMLNNTALIVLFGLLVVLIGPVCEELAFRGFVLPLLARTFGAAAGIIVTGILFGMLHGFEYPDWRPVVLVAVAGMVFGWRRYQTGSTINAALMHAGFNLTQFVALMAAKQAHLR